MKRNKKSGSLFENKVTPSAGAIVYAVVGYAPRETVRGEITQVWNPTGDLGGVTVDLKNSAVAIFHAPINVLFDHKPHLSQRQDSMGQYSAHV